MALFDVILPRSIPSPPRASIPRILTIPSPHARPLAPVPLVSCDSHLRTLQCSCTNLVRIPLCPGSRALEGRLSRTQGRSKTFIIDRYWALAVRPRATSVLRGSPRGPGFPLSGLPGVSCVPLPAGVSPWQVVFSAFVIFHARSRASSRAFDRPRASSGAGSPMTARLWE